MTGVPAGEALPKQHYNATGLDHAMERKAQRKDCAGLSVIAAARGRETEEGSEASQAGSFLGRLDEVEGSMHKMLALLEQCLD